MQQTSNAMKYAFLTLVCVLGVGCDSSRPAESPLKIVELRYSYGVSEVQLLADYGYIVDWPSDSKPNFYLFDNTNRKRVKFTSWKRFTDAIQKLPDGGEVDPVSKCMSGFAWGMPQAERDELQAIVETKKFHVSGGYDSPRHLDICTCESEDYEVIFDTTQ